jgi:hypothetical protein
MIKSLAIASALVIAGAGSVFAAEVGYSTQAGSSINTVTHGRSSNSFNGRSVTNSRTVSENGALGGGGVGSLSGGAGGGAGSVDRTISTNRTVENFRGGSSNRFSGSSNSSFSGASIFAN